MTWKTNQHSWTLSLAGGFIQAAIQWAVTGPTGYELSVNGHHWETRFDTIKLAKAQAEQYIRLHINKSLKELDQQHERSHELREDSNREVL